ncbi:MAG: DNA replication and repair protein RecF [Ignavibacteria bacterium]|jgi:DNA replication and repair protein RecF|nr:DNA replication and repair protein RecF [Ignavibacteria bacterium]
MNINNLLIKNLRNHIYSEYDFIRGINVLFGKNGVGKTTVLEAISICSISRSFVSTSDMMLVNKDAKDYSVTAKYINDLDVYGQITVSYTSKTKKNITSGSNEKLLPKDIIGEIPTVILSPDHKNITKSSPEFRRQFLNTILSQSNRFYIKKLFELRKVLKNRNILLQRIKLNPKISSDILTEWTNYFIEICTEIIWQRKMFLEEFTPYFLESYNIISEEKEDVSLSYQINGINEEIETIEQLKEELKKRSEKILEAEISRGMTLFGAQKDDLKIMINGGNSRDFASQGQHKTLLIALKFAEFKYLLEAKRETPIILLDDIFSELDIDRVSKVISLLSESSAQIFITSTETSFINSNINLDKKLIEIKVNDDL